MKGRRVWKTEQEKKFVKVFDSFSAKHNSWKVWSDFVSIFAIALSNATELDQKVHDEREKWYLDIVKSYSNEEMTAFSELAAITTMALKHNPQQDFLGELYMGLDFGSSWHGQFFTPWNVSFMMAKMMITPGRAKKEEDGYFSVCDTCCGAGCMLIAAAAAYQGDSEAPTYQNDILFVGQDLDQVVALMCYIQLSLLGCAGYVAIGNSLSNPICGHNLCPSIGEHGSLWFTPMWSSPVWVQRRIDYLTQHAEGHRIEESEEKKNVKTA